MSISERIRPNIEAAPWVCDEVGKLETSYESTKVRLIAANERIRELEVESDAQGTWALHLEKELAAEREVSDKLEKALKELHDLEVYRKEKGETHGYRTDSPRVYALVSAALAEVAAIRNSKGDAP